VARRRAPFSETPDGSSQGPSVLGGLLHRVNQERLARQGPAPAAVGASPEAGAIPAAALRSSPARAGRDSVLRVGNALEVEHLSVAFGRARVLDDLTFAVPERSALAIIGPNGSGKTVLFRALIGAVPCRGEFRWARGTRIGYVPQKLDLERDLPVTGLDFLRAKTAVTRASGAELRRALDLVGLSPESAARPIGNLSGGQFQRLLVAFALVGRPTVLLFDEPTAGVDEPGEERLYATIRRLQEQEGLTVLLISHELSLVYRHASSVLCLGRGRPCFGAPREILTPERLAEVYGTPVKFHDHDRLG
jgi:zinc transport system ATP-binding protein